MKGNNMKAPYINIKFNKADILTKPHVLTRLKLLVH